MPHKHRRNQKDANDFDLPPTKIAQPLPASKIKTSNETVFTSKKLQKPRAARANKNDDTPREFARLMRIANGEKPRTMLDNGDRLTKKQQQAKKRKRETPATATAGTANNQDGDDNDDDALDTKSNKKSSAQKTTAAETAAPAPKLKIRPGEKLSDFSARVNQSMPLMGLTNKGKKIEGIREHVPRHVRKLQKRTEHFRKEVDRQWAKRKEDDEDRDQEDEDTIEKYGDIVTEMDIATEVAQGRTMKGKKKRVKEEDPWAVLKKTREATAQKNIHDVVNAPPQFSVIPTEKLKERKSYGVNTSILAQGIPAASGDLRRREELGQERLDIIRKYRAMGRK